MMRGAAPGLEADARTSAGLWVRGRVKVRVRVWARVRGKDNMCLDTCQDTCLDFSSHPADILGVPSSTLTGDAGGDTRLRNTRGCPARGGQPRAGSQASLKTARHRQNPRGHCFNCAHTGCQAPPTAPSATPHANAGETGWPHSCARDCDLDVKKEKAHT